METGIKLGHYVLQEKLGEGGMGLVFLARDTRLDRQVALKILTVADADPATKRRFQREAECATGLNHPGLVKVYDFGEENGRAYLAMEMVSGATLADLVKEGPLTAQRTLKYGRQILEALEVCHAAGLLHRDLKPANVIIDGNDQPRLLDLGLVKPLDRTMLTEEGSRLGTPRYMPPEMIVHGEMDQRGDLYQVGLILHECLTSHPAFYAQSIPALIQKIVDEPPPPLPALTGQGAAQLPELIARLCAKDPAARFASCGEALEWIRRPPRRHASARISSSPRNPTYGAEPRSIAASSVPPDGMPLVRRVGLVMALLAVGVAAGVGVRSGLDRVASASPEAPVSTAAAGAASPSPVDPDAVIDAGYAKPLDLKVTVLPTRVRLKWRTAVPVIGAARMSGGSPVREAGPSLEHEIVLTGMAPGVETKVAVVGPDNKALEKRAVQLPSVREVLLLLHEALRELRPGELVAEAKRDFPKRMSTESQREGREKWNLRAKQIFTEGRFAVALEGWREISHLVADDWDVGVELRASVNTNLSALADFCALLEYIKVRSPVPIDELLGPTYSPVKELPAGLTPLWAFRLEDGGVSRGRPLPPLSIPYVQEVGPALFNSDMNAFLGENMGVSSRKQLERPGMLAKAEQKRAYLGFRIAGGSRVERFKIWTALADGSKRDFLGTLRGDPDRKVQQGFLRVDQRILNDPEAGLKIGFENRDAVWGGGGITLDYLVLYGEAGPAWGGRQPVRWGGRRRF